MSGKPKRTHKRGAAETLQITAKKGESNEQTYARVTLDPVIRHACNAMNYASQVFGKTGQPSIMESAEALQDIVAKAEAGDLQMVSRLLASQAYSLDTMFSELSRRSLINMGEYIDASERYMRLALKAQTACRSTLEALARLHQPREQIVKHVNVNRGGQAVVADQFHQHRGEGKNEKSDEQSHATGATGESSQMFGKDTEGNGVPITGRKGAKKMSNARRDQSGSA